MFEFCSDEVAAGGCRAVDGLRRLLLGSCLGTGKTSAMGERILSDATLQNAGKCIACKIFFLESMIFSP